jgi:hypothetical protein
MPRIKILFQLLILLAIILPCHLKAQVEENKLKAAIIEKMIAYIKWPSGRQPQPGGITFGFVGPSPIIKYIKQRASLFLVDKRPIVVKRISERAQISKCTILFISNSAAGDLEDILKITAHQPILTLGDSRGFAQRGVLINLFKVRGRVKFEINRDAVRKTGLKFSSNLYKLAKIVN